MIPTSQSICALYVNIIGGGTMQSLLPVPAP